VDSLLQRLDLTGCVVHSLSLICREETLRTRLQHDIETGLRSEDILERSLARLSLYKDVESKKLDVSDLTPTQSAEAICAMCGERNIGLNIVRVNADNYTRFDDMVFWRKNGIERTSLVQSLPVAILNELQNDNLHVYAAEIDGRFVGWISLIYLPKVGAWGGRGHVYVDELWVAPEFRRQGIAKQLMKQADELAERMHALGVRLYVNSENPSAKALYDGCGFERACTAYMMEKNREG
jgi:ribosomal protein S18 acetylase RimI-like enzyme